MISIPETSINGETFGALSGIIRRLEHPLGSGEAEDEVCGE
jgi:hypothetical protein